MKARKWRHLLFFPLIVVVLAFTCMAQDTAGNDDDDDDSNGNTSQYLASAILSLNFDSHGAADVTLTLTKAPGSWAPLQNAVRQALHCPIANLHNPEVPVNRFWNGMSQAQRDRYIKQIIEFNARILKGHCSVALVRRAAVAQGDIDYGYLATPLKAIGVKQLNINIIVPQTPHFEYSRAYLLSDPAQGSSYLLYQIPLEASQSQAALHLEYGFSRKDLVRSFSILAGFVLLPLAYVLWIRRRALINARTDATAAWFGFFRVLNWVVTGAMLFWITSGLGARQTLQDWVGNIDLPAWQAITANVIILVGPAFVVYFLCAAVSYPVYAAIKSDGWSPREFLVQQLVTVGAQAMPLMILLAALQVMQRQLQIAVVLFVFSYVILLVFQQLKLRVLKIIPQPLTQGALRDRVFTLARQMGVKLSQIFVLPAGKGQMANAFASAKNTVIFTDYLLQHLTRREVDAVAAHELAHLEHKHPGKRVVLFYAAVFSPWYFPLTSGLLMSAITLPLVSLRSGNGGLQSWILQIHRGMAAFNQWQQRDFVLILLGLTLFYFFSRRFENQADKTAARTLADPEAQILGLLKISRLNLMPLSFGKASERWLTHPSTLRRIERIAEVGGMPPERLREILDLYATGQSRGQPTLPADAAEDYYPIPQASPQKLRSAARQSLQSQVTLWMLLAAHVLPAALIVVLTERLHWPHHTAAGWLAGILFSATMVLLTGMWRGNSRQRRSRNQLRKELAGEGIVAGETVDTFVGFAPSAYPRFYTTAYYLAGGFLKLTQERLLFVGKKTRFSLNREEIEEIRMGPGYPSWWNVKCIYIRWQQRATGESRIMHFYLLEPCSVWRQPALAREVCRRLESWRLQRHSEAQLPEESATLPSPSTAEVTCRSPRQLGGIRAQLSLLAKLVPLAAGVSILLHADVLYIWGVAFAIRFLESIPYWRYRDKPVFAALPSANMATSRIQTAIPANSDAR